MSLTVDESSEPVVLVQANGGELDQANGGAIIIGLDNASADTMESAREVRDDEKYRRGGQKRMTRPL